MRVGGGRGGWGGSVSTFFRNTSPAHKGRFAFLSLHSYLYIPSITIAVFVHHYFVHVRLSHTPPCLPLAALAAAPPRPPRAALRNQQVTFTFKAQSSSCKNAWVQCYIAISYTVRYGRSMEAVNAASSKLMALAR